jgi:ankyrin repeat protein
VLLRNGADPSLATREGDTPVELALRLGHAKAAEVLKKARQGSLGGPQIEDQPATQAG